MANGKNQPFNADEWLNTRKKGISGKVPRADFLVKMKELGAEIEEKKQLLEKQAKEKQELETKNKELRSNLSDLKSKCDEWEEKSKTSQTELQNKDNELAEGKVSTERIKQELTAKLVEQEKILQSKEKEVKNLQQRPDITEEKYQELQKNQEKHAEEDLKPVNLPTDWEQQLNDKKALETKLLETQTKLKVAEQRPTSEQLQQAVQQEAEKYKDYDSIKANYLEIKKKYKELRVQESNLPPPIVELGKGKEEIIKSIEESLNSALNPLQLEIVELKKQLINNPSSESSSTNSSSELPTDYQEIKEKNDELLKILKTLNTKII